MSSNLSLYSTSLYQSVVRALGGIHGVARLPAAEGRAAALASRDELEGPGANLLARGRHADEAALAPAAVRRLERRAHHVGVARAVERVVKAEASGRLADEHLGTRAW